MAARCRRGLEPRQNGRDCKQPPHNPGFLAESNHGCSSGAARTREIAEGAGVFRMHVEAIRAPIDLRSASSPGGSAIPPGLSCGCNARADTSRGALPEHSCSRYELSSYALLLSETCLLNIAEPRVIGFDLNIIISMLHFWLSSLINHFRCPIYFPLLSN